MKRFTAILALLTALVMLSSIFALPASAAKDTTGFTEEVLRLINAERTKEGLGTLTMGSSSLTAAANLRAREAAAKWSHTRPSGKQWHTVLDDYSISYMHAGENLAYGQNTPASVVAAWMNSPDHKENILSANYTQLSVGIYENSGGTLYWSQLFLHPNSSSKSGSGISVGFFSGIVLTVLIRIWNFFVGLVRF